MPRTCFKWIVLTAAFMAVLTSIGFMQSIGLFVTEWQEEFDASAEEIGWIGSCFIFGYAVAGLLLATLSSLVSCRVSTIFGGATACICLSLGYLANSPWHLYLVMSATGFGLGCVLNGSVAIVGYYFKSNLGLINGIVYSGGSFGLLVLPPLFHYLIDVFSWRGAMLINAGVAANVCVYGALFRSSQEERARSVSKKKGSSSNDIQLYYTKKTTDTQRHDERLHQFSHDDVCYEANTPSTSTPYSQSSFRKIGRAVQHIDVLALFTNSRAMLHCFCQFLRGFGYFAAMVYFVSLAVDNNISKNRATFLLSLMGVTGTILRLGHGYILDKKLITPIHLQSLSLVIGGGSCLLIAFSHSYATLTAFAVIWGGCNGIFNILHPIILREIVEAHQFKAALGLVLAFNFFGSLIGVPIVGALFDATQNYAASYYVAGSVLIAGGLIHLADDLLVRHQRGKPKHDTYNEDVDYL